MDTYEYQTELETFTLAAAVSIAFNDPASVQKLKPGHGDPIDLEDIPPMLRPVRNRG